MSDKLVLQKLQEIRITAEFLKDGVFYKKTQVIYVPMKSELLQVYSDKEPYSSGAIELV